MLLSTIGVILLRTLLRLFLVLQNIDEKNFVIIQRVLLISKFRPLVEK